MSPPDPLDALIDACGHALGLTIEPAWKADIKIHLTVLLQAGATVAAKPLPDDAEPAPVFQP